MVRQPDGKRQPAACRRRWEDNIRRDLNDVRWGRGVELIFWLSKGPCRGLMCARRVPTAVIKSD